MGLNSGRIVVIIVRIRTWIRVLMPPLIHIIIVVVVVFIVRIAVAATISHVSICKWMVGVCGGNSAGDCV